MQRKDIKVRSSTGDGEFDCYMVTPDGGSHFLSAREIAVGEELTVDYRLFNDPEDGPRRS